MTKKTNINGTIINFFKGLSTYPFNNGYGPLKSESNSGYYIYRSENYEERLQRLSIMLLNNNIRDIEQLNYVKNVINKWLSSSLYDERLFNFAKLKSNPEKNLFDNRIIENIDTFCHKFKLEIETIMLNVVQDRFLIFPVKNLFTENFSFGNIGFLNKDFSIRETIEQYFDKKCIDLVVHRLLEYGYDSNIFEDADGFIYIRTRVGDNFLSKSEHDIKNFVTVCLSTIKEKPSSILICLREQFTMSACFDDFATVYYNKFRDPVIPSIADNQIESFDFDEVNKWYDTFNKLELDKKERIDRCIYLINNAFSNKKFKKFIDICQGIDALFGVDKKVTASIKLNLENIINQYNGDSLFIEKIDKLLKLRHHLVHGVIKDIRDSKIYLDYQLKYLSCPEDDYLDLSLFCIKNSVHYFDSGFFLDLKDNNAKLDNYSKLKNYLKNIFKQ